MAVYFKPTKKKPDAVEALEDIKKENEKLKEDLAAAQAINKTNMIGIMELANRMRELEEKQ